MPKKTEQIIEPIDANFDDVTKKLASASGLKSAGNVNSVGGSIPVALYIGVLPIGNVELDCAVLDNGDRVLTASSVFKAFERPRKGANSRLEINGTKIPPFLAAKNLEPYINQEVIRWTTPVEYMDGKSKKTGYIATILPNMCDVYLRARRDENVLTESQEKLAKQSEILLLALAQVGIDALIDEATGAQIDRKHDALRMLLAKYLAEGMQRWVLTFKDPFFAELDRLYGNETTTARSRPQYYGKFINKYIYDPIEHGYLKSKLNELNISADGKRKAKFHQWLNEDGRSVVIHQIGKVEGQMGEYPTIEKFHAAKKHQKMVSIAPYLFDEFNKPLDKG
jgi:hypothetical protein